MCGIAAIIGGARAGSVKAMCDAVKHRGPDSSGYWGFGEQSVDFTDEDSIVSRSPISESSQSFQILFGHRRLSILDLSEAGHQPMHLNDRYTLTFNGEIYNYLELKEELVELGYTFQSSSDTEVILAAYSAWGKDCAKKFNGMWALLLYDRVEDVLFMSRDRFGIKPLYYYENNGTFYFASEIKQILAVDEVKKEISPNSSYLKDFVKLGSLEFKVDTAFEGIFSFPIASSFQGPISDLKNLALIAEVYWEVPDEDKSIAITDASVKEHAEAYFHLLKDAVALRMRADVKVGSALSGGIDSSSIVYLVNEILKEQGRDEGQQVTFSSVYPGMDETIDESKYIEALAKFLDVDSRKIAPEEADIIKEHSKMILALDNPPDTTLMSSWHTFKLVGGSDVTVTLDGQGADEILAGYNRYLMNYLIHSGSEFKKRMEIVKDWPGKAAVANQAAKFIKLKRLGLDKAASALGAGDLKSFMTLHDRLKSDISELLGNLLHYSDRTSMAFSKESRVPFLDYRLVEFVMKLPDEMKIHEGWTKYLSRLGFDKKLPDDIVWRKDKLGWPIPEQDWFDGSLKEWKDRTIESSELLGDLGMKNISEDDLQIQIRKLNIAVWHQTFFRD